MTFSNFERSDQKLVADRPVPPQEMADVHNPQSWEGEPEIEKLGKAAGSSDDVDVA